MMNIKSDPALVTEVRKYGNFNSNACYQCGSCTITCNLTNNSASFPRRIIQYALMGLREPLQGSLEPWLCYYCGDCSTTCPRQAEPGESMMTLRRYLGAQYDWTGLASRVYTSKVWEIASLLVVGIFVLILAAYYHLKIVELEVDEFISMPMGMEHMFGLIKTFTLVVFLLPVFFLIPNAVRMYRFTMHRGTTANMPLSLYLTEAKTFIVHAFTQMRFRECRNERSHWIKHLFLVAGCLIMFVILVFFLEWFQTDNIYPIYHPQRWLGYLATVALIYGSLEILIGRIRKRKEIHKFSDMSDWILPIMLLLTAVSGIAVHIFRYLEFSLAAHFTYAVHLAIAVPMLVIEIPFGKWSHMMYRPLAIYFETVKEKAMEQQLPSDKEVVVEHAG